MPDNGNRKNLNLALNLVLIVIGMLALTYASVPLYRIFCKVTGYGGTTQQSSIAPAKIINRDIAIDFNADTDPALPWEFKPAQERIHIKVGQQQLTHYTARNTSNHAITGRATYNVLPFSAGSYFVKISCFCFKEQTLKAGEEVDMPVVFYVDPSIMNDPEMNDLKTITLSYTFFPVKTEPKIDKKPNLNKKKLTRSTLCPSRHIHTTSLILAPGLQSVQPPC